MSLEGRHSSPQAFMLSSAAADLAIDMLKRIGFSTSTQLPLRKESILLLKVISFFDCESIDENILIKPAQQQKLRGYFNSVAEYYTAREELLGLYVVFLVEDGTIHVHPSVTTAVREKLREENELTKWFDMSYKLVRLSFRYSARKAVGHLNMSDQREQRTKLVHHVVWLGKFYESEYDAEGPETIPNHLEPGVGPERDFADLLNEAAWYFVEISRPLNAKPLVDLAQKISSQDDIPAMVAITAERRVIISTTQAWLSFLLNHRVDPNGLLKHGQELGNQLGNERERGPTYQTKLLHDYGVALLVTNQYYDAYETLSIAKNGLQYVTPDHPLFEDLDKSLDYHKALARYCSRINLAEAEYLLEALEKAELEKLGGTDRKSIRLGKIYYALGNVYSRLFFLTRGPNSKLIQIHNTYIKAVDHLRDTLGLDHHLTARAQIKLAHHLIRQGKALIYAKDCLVRALQILKGRHEEGCKSGYNLYHLPELVWLYHLYAQAPDLTATEQEDMHKESVKCFNELGKLGYHGFHREETEILSEADLSECTVYDF